MPATTYLTLFDVETHVEAAWKELLTDYGAAAFTQREFEKLPARRIDIQCSLGAATGHRHKDNTGTVWLDAWAYRLTLGIVTPRKIKQVAQTTLHADYRAKVRVLAQYASGVFTEALLPYHTLTQIQEDGTAPSVVSGDDCDVSEIAFRGIVSIRANAWPSSDVPTFDSDSAFRFDSDTTPTFDTST